MLAEHYSNKKRYVYLCFLPLEVRKCLHDGGQNMEVIPLNRGTPRSLLLWGGGEQNVGAQIEHTCGCNRAMCWKRNIAYNIYDCIAVGLNFHQSLRNAMILFYERIHTRFVVVALVAETNGRKKKLNSAHTNRKCQYFSVPFMAPKQSRSGILARAQAALAHTHKYMTV